MLSEVIDITAKQVHRLERKQVWGEKRDFHLSHIFSCTHLEHTHNIKSRFSPEVVKLLTGGKQWVLKFDKGVPEQQQVTNPI